jgi:hypothetical protein
MIVPDSPYALMAVRLYGGRPKRRLLTLLAEQERSPIKLVQSPRLMGSRCPAWWLTTVIDDVRITRVRPGQRLHA